MEDELKDYIPSAGAQKWFREHFGGKGIADPWPRLLMYAWDTGYGKGFDDGVWDERIPASETAWMCSTAFYDELGHTDTVLYHDPHDIPCCSEDESECWPVRVQVVIADEETGVGAI